MEQPDRLVLIADVHANLEALTEVLKDVPESDESTEIICIGDVVGYGPSPSECLQTLTDYDAKLLAGNHDAAACGEMSTRFFNRLASDAAQWTHDQLSESERGTLAELPHELHKNGIAFVHGSPHQPLTEYITSEPMAADALDKIEESKLAVGHTHKPIYFKKDRATTRSHLVRGSEQLEGVPLDTPMVINPGSVGQPRDGDPRASYMEITFNADHSLNLEWKRREYPVEVTQSKIREAGLPEALATRLSQGQ